MSAQTSLAEKGLNPGLMCQESYACSGTDEAVFECDECCSLQCLRCEEELHRQERLRNHERIRLKAGHVPYCDPCKGPNGHSPGVRQRAAVRCQTCKINLCLECQKRTHSGGNKRRHPVTVYHVSKVQESLEGEEMDEETKRRKMTERVVSFLLVDENEEIQITPQRLLRSSSRTGSGSWAASLKPLAPFITRERGHTIPPQTSLGFGVPWNSC